MLRFFNTLCLIFFSLVGFAQNPTNVQVDLVVFTHAYTEKDQLETASTPLMQDLHTAIQLKPRDTESGGSYRLISTAHSTLQNAWYQLNRHSQYTPLFHYTWIQPSNNQKAVILPHGSSQGWSVQGTVRVRQSNYYLLDTTLQFKPLGHSQANFTLSQKMRLKPGNTYYIDHPQGGMLINVHRIG